ncbi:MAG: response regulator [Longimicrobiales bacterium]
MSPSRMAGLSQDVRGELKLARILLIDDEHGVRSVARLILERAGHEVVEASDGSQGMTLFRRGAFDLVITDLYMPDKEGIETIQDIVGLGREIPILAMSGGGGVSAQTGDALVDAQLFGANGTLAKPFSAEALRDAVDELLSSSQVG